jgi:hypothetical protein
MMDGIGRPDLRMQNNQSFFSFQAATDRPAGSISRRPERFHSVPLVTERQIRGLDHPSQPVEAFPTRMLSLVQNEIQREPGRALESQANIDVGNVVAILGGL